MGNAISLKSEKWVEISGGGLTEMPYIRLNCDYVL